MYRPHLSHFWANINFSRSQLSHFLFMYLPYIELFTFHLQYKHSGAFANRKIIWRTVLPLKSGNVPPHSTNSIENATRLLIVNPVVKMRPHPEAHPHWSTPSPLEFRSVFFSSVYRVQSRACFSKWCMGCGMPKLHRDYGIARKFVSGWRVWRTLLNKNPHFTSNRETHKPKKNKEDKTRH